jgi:hypothetical protein
MILRDCTLHGELSSLVVIGTDCTCSCTTYNYLQTCIYLPVKNAPLQILCNN